ncbi:MAG: endonuclease/exonuclease/phosphatase family protein, partial [Rhizobiaceae bacterium]|nr:endonuclease/exonuclease/phosphatase family protein [Rhizobiaceae bacterium]
MAPAPLRIVSWNVHGCVGADWRCDPLRTFAVIAALKPDILALQEIDGRTHLRRHSRAFETFAERLGGHRVEARLVRKPDRDYGHLLWSRWPLAQASVRRL